MKHPRRYIINILFLALAIGGAWLGYIWDLDQPLPTLTYFASGAVIATTIYRLTQPNARFARSLILRWTRLILALGLLLMAAYYVALFISLRYFFTF